MLYKKVVLGHGAVIHAASVGDSVTVGMGPFRASGPMATDRAKCLPCCACVKRCPTGARRVTGTRISQSLEKLITLCRDRKEPEFLFAK